MLDLPRAPDLRKLSKRVNVIGAAPAPIRTRTPRRVRGRIRVHVNVILRRNDNCYRRHEQEKKRAYDQRIREVEHGCFSPLVFSATGGMGPTAKVVYKKLASMIATKHNQSYSQTINWLRCRLSFSLLRSSIMCIRGSRSSAHHPANPQLPEAAIDRALCDSRVTAE